MSASCGSKGSRLAAAPSLRVAALRALALNLLVAVATIDCAAASPPEGAPRAVLAATTHSLGRVPRGTVLSERFVIDNAGSTPLVIESMQFSSPGLRARVTQNIAPGKSAEIFVDWDTANYTRDAEAQVALQLQESNPAHGVNSPTNERVSVWRG